MKVNDYFTKVGDYLTKDYNAKLSEDYTEIKRRVERGMLPLVARNPAVEKATSEYALARADHYHAEQAKGKTPPIPFKDAPMLEKYADLILYEELKWSHPDKMSIVEYPVMSDRQERTRSHNNVLVEELSVGDIRGLGRRRVLSNMVNDNGEHTDGEPTHTTVRRILQFQEDDYDIGDARMIVSELLHRTKLSARQRQAIDLIFFENMTQEEAGRVMGVRKHTVNEHLTISLRKLREKAELMGF